MNKIKPVSSWGKETRTDEQLRFILDNAEQMSIEELATALKLKPNQILHVCSSRGIKYFRENSRSWKRKGYIEGTNGYAMYPYKGSHRESASVTNAMLRGE